MNDFAFSQAKTAKEAIGFQSSMADSRFIAGGTNLIDLMKEGVVAANGLIDINRIGNTGINRLDDGGLRIGAGATNAQTAYDPVVQKSYPLLTQAILAGASPQLRNMATNGGNLLQRTRCYYFYDTAAPCNKREPGSGCSALNGVNRIHAILGYSDQCIAVHPSDMCVALAALGAVVQINGARGPRTVPFSEFHRLPGEFPQLDNVLERDELIIALDLPIEGFAQNFAYIKARERNSYAFALASAAVGLRVKSGKILEARIAMGGIAHKPWRRQEAEQILVGSSGEPRDFSLAADYLLEGARGFGQNDYKIQLAHRVLVQALKEAFAMNSSGGQQ